MDEIYELLKQLDGYNVDKEQVKKLKENLKGIEKEIKTAENEKSVMISGSLLRVEKEEFIADKRIEEQKIEEEIRKQTDKAEEGIKAQKKQIQEKIKEEMSVFRTARSYQAMKEQLNSEVAQLETSKKAYLRVAENAKRTQEVILEEIKANNFRRAEKIQEMKQEEQENLDRVKSVDRQISDLKAEFQQYKSLEEYREEYIELENLSVRISNISFDTIEKVETDPFYKKYEKQEKKKRQDQEEEKKQESSKKSEEEKKVKEDKPQEEVDESKIVAEQNAEEAMVKDDDEKKSENPEMTEEQKRKLEEDRKNRLNNLKDFKVQNANIEYDGKSEVYFLNGKETEWDYINGIALLKDKLGIEISKEKYQVLDEAILGILMELDEKQGTTRAKDYVVLLTNDMSLEMRKKFAQDKNMNISYNLKGLYNPFMYTRQERKRILRAANALKELGIGEVEKGFITATGELPGKAFRGIGKFAKNIFRRSKTELLPETIYDKVGLVGDAIRTNLYDIDTNDLKARVKENSKTEERTEESSTGNIIEEEKRRKEKMQQIMNEKETVIEGAINSHLYDIDNNNLKARLKVDLNTEEKKEENNRKDLNHQSSHDDMEIE